MTKEEEFYSSIGQNIEGAQQSQLFGKSCFKINGKAFICFFQNEMVFKLNGDTHHEALSLSGTQLFDPSGKHRPMKAWVQIPSIHSSYWTAFSKSASEFVNKGLSRCIL